jgi:hypothetical protein
LKIDGPIISADLETITNPEDCAFITKQAIRHNNLRYPRISDIHYFGNIIHRHAFTIDHNPFMPDSYFFGNLSSRTVLRIPGQNTGKD